MFARLSLSSPALSSSLNRLPMGGLLCALALLAGVALAWAQTPSPAGSGVSAPGAAASLDAAGPQDDQRVREGTELLETPGHFLLAGDRVTFLSADGKTRLVALENLSLERVAQTIGEYPGQLQWSVTGTVTEYRGTNYLLVRRAVLNSRISTGAGAP